MKATKKVLVVDDDPVVGSSFERVLSSRGYAVMHASDGPEAFDRLARDDYDVVYTDIKMPGMSGIEVAKRIKASRPWLPVVIVTGYGSQQNEAEAKEAGVEDFLRKPLSPEMIEGSLDRALEAVVPAEPAAKPAMPEPEAAEATPQPRTVGRFLRNAALFLASPFIGLVYAIALPFVGIGLLAWTAWKALTEKKAA